MGFAGDIGIGGVAVAILAGLILGTRLPVRESPRSGPDPGRLCRWNDPKSCLSQSGRPCRIDRGRVRPVPDILREAVGRLLGKPRSRRTPLAPTIHVRDLLPQRRTEGSGGTHAGPV